MDLNGATGAAGAAGPTGATGTTGLVLGRHVDRAELSGKFGGVFPGVVVRDENRRDGGANAVKGHDGNCWPKKARRGATGAGLRVPTGRNRS